MKTPESAQKARSGEISGSSHDDAAPSDRALPARWQRGVDDTGRLGNWMYHDSGLLRVSRMPAVSGKGDVYTVWFKRFGRWHSQQHYTNPLDAASAAEKLLTRMEGENE